MSERRPSPSDRKKSTREAFEAKVLLLEKWAEHGLPSDVDYYPDSQAKLRQWRGPAGDLGVWTDAKIDQVKEGGKHPKLAQRFVDAVQRLAARAPSAVEGVKIGRLKEVEAERDKALADKAALKVQNAELIGKLESANNTLDLATADLERVREELSELRRQISGDRW